MVPAMQPAPTGDDDIQVIRGANGEVQIFDPELQAAQQAGVMPAEVGDDDDSRLGDDDHDANLVDAIAKMPGGEDYLDKLAKDLTAAIERDEQSRAKWKKVKANGVRLMGVTPDRVGGANFKGSSKVVHPVLTEAIVQFQARAMAEVWPSTGPVKSFIPGKMTPDLRARGKRVEAYMNWQYTVDMEEAFWEMDQMLFVLPLEGSAFKQQYYDAILMRTTTRFLPADDVIVSNKATSLKSAPRVTVKLRQRENEMNQYYRLGIYRDCKLQSPSIMDDTDDEVDDAIAASEGRDKTSDDEDTNSEVSAEEYLNYQTRCEVDLMGFEDRETPSDVWHPGLKALVPDTMTEGEVTGRKLPYIVTINKDNQKILSIVRNWDDEDQHKRAQMDLTHYKYLPGLGFYGYGLLHTIGSLTEAATGALRALLDSAQFANMQGGFKTKDIKIGDKGELVVAPGQWLDVPATVDDIRKGLLPLPYKEPSDTLFRLLGALVEYAQRFASTTEAMVGDAANTGPVGTTMALIEQGSKVFSGIHKRVYKALGEEFAQMRELDEKHLPPEGLTFNFGGNDEIISQADFDEKLTILPVADPNIISQTQRITMAQGVKQLASDPKNGVMYNQYEVDRNMLEAMRVSDIDRFLKDPNKKALPSLAPLYENFLMMTGKPVQAYLHQDHKAHMQAHQLAFQALPPEMQKQMQPAFLAHQAEHTAMLYFTNMQQLMGVDLPPPPQFNGPDTEESMQAIQLPPEVENKVAQLTVIAGGKANAIQQQMQQNAAAAPGPASGQPGQQPQPGPPDPRQAAADQHAHGEELKNKSFQADQQRKSQATAMDLARTKAKQFHSARMKTAA